MAHNISLPQRKVNRRAIPRSATECRPTGVSGGSSGERVEAEQAVKVEPRGEEADQYAARTGEDFGGYFGQAVAPGAGLAFVEGAAPECASAAETGCSPLFPRRHHRQQIVPHTRRIERVRKPRRESSVQADLRIPFPHHQSAASGNPRRQKFGLGSTNQPARASVRFESPSRFYTGRSLVPADGTDQNLWLPSDLARGMYRPEHRGNHYE